MKKQFKLSLLVLVLFTILPVSAKQGDSHAVKPFDAKAETEFEEKLWKAQRTFEAGNLEEAELLYRKLLGEREDEPRALLGLARVFHRQSRRDGKYPPGMAELMKKLESIIEEQGKGVAAMQRRLRDGADPRAFGSRTRRDDYVPEEASKWGFSNSNAARERSRHWQPGSDGRMDKSPRQNQDDYYSKKEDAYSEFRFTPAILFRGDCPEPEFNDWFFLDPPS